jgi:plastocyanin
MRWHVTLVVAATYLSPLVYIGSSARVSANAPAARVASVDGVQGRVEILERNGATKDLDGTILWLEGDGLGTAQPQRLEITMSDKTFRPAIIVAPAGSTVSFPNRDDFDHNVFSRSATKSFDLGLYGRDASKSVELDHAGLVNVYCNVHSRMSAVILVHASKFASRADATGRFELGSVPAGSYTLHAWHERGGDKALPLVVPLTGEIVVRLDARNYRFVEHLDKTGKRYDARGRRY